MQDEKVRDNRHAFGGYCEKEVAWPHNVQVSTGRDNVAIQDTTLDGIPIFLAKFKYIMYVARSTVVDSW